MVKNAQNSVYVNFEWPLCFLLLFLSNFSPRIPLFETGYLMFFQQKNSNRVLGASQTLFGLRSSPNFVEWVLLQVFKGSIIRFSVFWLWAPHLTPWMLSRLLFSRSYYIRYYEIHLNALKSKKWSIKFKVCKPSKWFQKWVKSWSFYELISAQPVFSCKHSVNYLSVQ